MYRRVVAPIAGLLAVGAAGTAALAQDEPRDRPRPPVPGDRGTFAVGSVPPELARLADDPAVREAVAAYYGRHATELDGRCRGLRMAEVRQAATLQAEGDGATLQVAYAFATADPAAAGIGCSGVGDRLFTLAPDAAGGGWRVVDMTGARAS